MTLKFLFSSAAIAAVGDSNHGNHIAVNEEKSNFPRLEFLERLQQYTAG